VKHFKNLQQIGYATDHGNSYADRERKFPSFLKEKLAHIFALFCRLETVVTSMAVDGHMLTRARNEMDYRIDVCRITKGGHIEHL
jgi:hypothetical protein